MGKLQHAFFIFLGLLVLHDLAIFALKMATSIPFRKARWQTKLLHLLESTNVPDTFMDWNDEEEDEKDIRKTPEEYRIRWKSVLNETVGMIGLQMLSNLLMLVPVFATSEFLSSVYNDYFVISSVQSEREALDPPRQHWDVRQGGRGLRPADQAELAVAHLRHRLRHPRPRPGFRLPQVAPPVEDHPARGKL